MEIAALSVAALALVVSVASAAYARRTAHAAEREAEAATSAERRANRPTLVVEIEAKVGETDDSAIYNVRNDGPIDLDSISVHPPTPDDGIRYPVARVGSDWADHAAGLGAVRMGERARFVLAIGAREKLPDFRVRLVATRGADEWEQVVLLDNPRRGRVRIIFPT
ncbi:hypothetical protein [Nocardioides conyzicola]